MYWRYIEWYRHYFGEDTQYWFLVLIIRELIEIIVQIIAIYNFNGLNLFNWSEITLAANESNIKLFATLLCSNSVIVGILWFLYLCKYGLCHGEIFKQTVFVIDTIFDAFYALFPIIVVANQSTQFNITSAIGSLQSQNLYVFVIYIYIYFFFFQPSTNLVVLIIVFEYHCL